MIRGPYNSNKHSSYVEIVIVVDNKAFKSFNENIKKVHQHCKDLANIMNAVSFFGEYKFKENLHNFKYNFLSFYSFMFL